MDRTKQGESMAIQLLSDRTINQIAAGEVIENPSSVVKELVENSVDAKSSSITVEIENGGFSVIRIIDNGSGIAKEDLPLSIKRHATSKIKEVSDLQRIYSMGFRGEALASIGAISKLKIISKKDKSLHGYSLQCSGGVESKVVPIAWNCGTLIEVSSLFFNVPARKKFQGGVGSSNTIIRKVILNVALSNPELELILRIDGKEVINLQKHNSNERWKAIFGRSVIEEVSPIDACDEGLQISGWIGSPQQTKLNRSGQHIFINSRPVISREISLALKNGYGTRIEPNQHPICVINLALDPSMIDVNVHPQKRDIRINKICRALSFLEREVMRTFSGAPTHQFSPKIEWNLDQRIQAAHFQKPVEINSQLPFEKSEFDIPVIGIYNHFLFVGQTPLINLQPANGIYVVNLEACSKRILYEKFLSNPSCEMQSLLFPKNLEFSVSDAEKLNNYLDEIKSIGIDIKSFGNSSFAVDALHPEIDENKLQEFLERICSEITLGIQKKELQKKLAFSASYTATLKKCQWSVSEAKYLLKQLLKTKNPFDCPRGKKTITNLTDGAIENLFKRKTH